MRPPSIASLLRMEGAECIDETGTEQVGNSLAFFASETGVMGILFGASEINLGMSSIKVTTDNDGLGLLKKLELLQDGWIPNLFTELKTREIRFAIGRVDIDEIKVLIFGDLEAAFGERTAVFIILIRSTCVS